MNYVGKRARINANLNAGGIAIRIKGIVVNKDDYATCVEMTDVDFVIQPSQQAAARKSGQRNVHAFAEGVISQVRTTPVSAAELKKLRNSLPRIRYNVFKEGYFVCEGRRIDSASSVVMVLGDRYDDKGRRLCELFLNEP
jgi:hypothetical protein